MVVSSPLLIGLSCGQVKQLPRVILEDSQVLVHYILVQEVVMKLCPCVVLLIARRCECIQFRCLGLALLARHLELIDVPSATSFNVERSMHEGLIRVICYVSLVICRAS